MKEIVDRVELLPVSKPLFVLFADDSESKGFYRQPVYFVEVIWTIEDEGEPAVPNISPVIVEETRYLIPSGKGLGSGSDILGLDDGLLDDAFWTKEAIEWQKRLEERKKK